MKILSIELENFRNYQNQKIFFNEDKNLIIGKNAQGKTNLLEAIYLLCLTKSFRTEFEKEAISFSNETFIIKGKFELDSGVIKRVVLLYSKNEGRQLSVNRKRITRVSEFIGSLPVVISSPEEYNLTIGPPTARRRFIDILISQINKRYISVLIEYQKVLKNRNALLFNWKQAGKRDTAVFEVWNDRLISLGSEIIGIRGQFSKHLSDKLKKIYLTLISNNEELEFYYQPNVDVGQSENIEEKFRSRLEQVFGREQQRGITLIGPHRDDFVFKINRNDIKKYGSRGQHKTVLIALAIAECQLIEERSNEKPIILIDDLFSELDGEREQKIIHSIEKLGQIFITATDLRTQKPANFSDRYISINEGIAEEKYFSPDNDL